MNTIETILNLLQGKKTVIFSIAQSITVYLVATGLISTDLSVLITSIITALAGGANYAGYKIGQAKK